MKAAIDQFRINIGRVRHLGTIHKFLTTQTTQVLDLSDILRSEYVMAVSTLDLYIHELVRLGMLEIYQGKRPQTPAFLQFSVSLESALQGITTSTDIDWLDNEIRVRHSWRSFQRDDKIAEAIRLISSIKLWEEVAKQLDQPPQHLRNQLKVIVERRDKIAHEADIDPTFDPTFPDNRWPINETEVDEAINFIEQIAETIYSLLILRV